jgi:hypothetical protein
MLSAATERSIWRAKAPNHADRAGKRNGGRARVRSVTDGDQLEGIAAQVNAAISNRCP